MNVFAKRYFACLSLIFLAFSAIPFKYNGFVIFTVFSIISLIIYLLMRKLDEKSKNQNILLILTLIAAFVGTVNSQMNLFKNENMIEKYSGLHTIEGYIKEDLSKEGYLSEQIMHVESVDGKKTSFDAVIIADYKTEFYRGDFIQFSTEFFALKNYEDLQFLKSNKEYEYPLACSIGEDTDIKAIGGSFRLEIALADLNEALSYRLKYTIGKDAGALSSALLLGNRGDLSQNTLLNFRRAGIYHMLALSGMHVAILIGILEFLLKKCYAPRWLCTGFVALSSIFYIALTGFLPSTVRAVIMMLSVYLAFIVERQGDSITFLFASVFLIVLFDPTAIMDLGLILSFMSTLGVLVAILIKKKIKLFSANTKLKGITKLGFELLQDFAFLVLTSICVFIATLPTLCFYFGEVSLATFFTNLFMGAICEIFMVLSLITLIFAGNVTLGQFFGEITNNFGSFMLESVDRIADTKNIVLSLNYPGAKILVLGLFTFSILFLSLKLVRKWLVAVPVVAFAFLMTINVIGYNTSIKGQVKSEFIYGDALVLTSNEGAYLCDASDGRYLSLSEGYRLARESCYTELDGVILTHYHSRYVVSLQRLVSNTKLNELYLPMPKNSEEGQILSAISNALESENVKIYIYDLDKPIEILSGELIVSSAKLDGSTHSSVAFTYSYGESRITVLERPYFETYLENSGTFDNYISDSDLLIFGSDGKNPENNFEIFPMLKKESEVVFTDYYMLELSDFEKYMANRMISFEVKYKKYILK